MKKTLIILGIIILLLVLAYIFVSFWGPSRYEKWKNKSSSSLSPTTAFTPGSQNQVLEDSIKGKKTCEKLGKTWLEINCIKAPCPGKCI